MYYQTCHICFSGACLNREKCEEEAKLWIEQAIQIVRKKKIFFKTNPKAKIVEDPGMDFLIKMAAKEMDKT